jgi:hypothetical protein
LFPQSLLRSQLTDQSIHYEKVILFFRGKLNAFEKCEIVA